MSCCPPGAQGATGTGIHGMGVSTPIAAVVADATIGLLSVVHIPKGMTLTIGAKSIIVAFGLFWIIGRIGLVTIRVEGIWPNVHFSTAPIHTYLAMAYAVLLVVGFQLLLFQFGAQFGGGGSARHRYTFGRIGCLEG